MRDLLSRKRTVVITITAALLALVGVGAAVATGDDDASDRPIEGPAAQRAEEAALAETGGGRVTGTEVGDEDSYYEVEVTLEDGSQVDVQLDRDFQVVDATQDDEEPGDS